MIDKDICKRFRFFRESLNKKQGEFAIDLNVNQQSVSDIERGIKNISLEVIEILLVKFNLNANWLITGHGLMLKGENTLQSITVSEPLVTYESSKKKSDISEECNNCKSLEKQLIERTAKLMDAQEKIIKLQEELLQRPTPVVPVVNVPTPIQRST